MKYALRLSAVSLLNASGLSASGLGVLLSALVAALFAGTAQAQPGSPITFIDGGYSEYCAQAARNPDNMPRVIITGSRNPLSGIQLCTLAIQEGGANRINTAANYNNRGVLHYAAGNHDAALSDFTEAVRLDESLVFAHINRGNILNLREQWAEAIQAFDRAITLGVQPQPAQSGAASETVESSEAWHARVTQELARAHFNRGIAHENLEHVREAYLDYLKASALAPDWDDPKRELERFQVVR